MKTLETAIKQIEAAGFTHLKLELEAQLDREDQEEAYVECSNCDGTGHFDGSDQYPDGTWMQQACYDCDGEGEVRNDNESAYSDTDVCEQFIKDRLSDQTLNAINYMNFYNDGSVDSELTFTLPIREAARSLEVIEAFKDLAEANGNGMDIDGAGMHVSLLTSSSYPSRSLLDLEKLQNFNHQVSKLLPALFVAATSGNFTRDFGYRYPRISNDDKYSAIYTHGSTCLEYRLFETCYQRPTALYEYLGVIAKTLAYYVDPTKQVPSIGTQYPMYTSGLKGLVELPEQIAVIKKQMSLIKPDGITIRDLMAHRSIILKVTDARKEQYFKKLEIRKAYKEHKKAHKALTTRPLTQYQQDNIEYWMRENPGQSSDWYIEKVTGMSMRLIDEETFIKNNMRRRTPSLTLSV